MQLGKSGEAGGRGHGLFALARWREVPYTSPHEFDVV